MSLQRAALAARRVAARAVENPLLRMDWVVPQLDFLMCPSKIKLLRAGNQAVGKSTVGLAECVHLATGTPPAQPGRVAKDIWILCASWSQSVAIQRKLWDLTPKAQVDPKQKYDAVKGFGGHQPSLKFKNGSLIQIKTTQQGSLNLAGATIDHALFDEPPASSRVFAEVLKRVQARSGSVSLTLTPIGTDCGWIKDLVEAGKIHDLHYYLSPENLIHVKSKLPRRLPDGTICDQAWIDKIRSESLPWEEPIVCDGLWEGRLVNRLFDVFNTERHVIKTIPKGTYDILLGIDHGTARGKQAAILAFYLPPESKDGYPKVIVADEYRPQGATTPEQDADGILGMLKRNGVAWSEVDHATGDRPVGSRDSADRKGNFDLEDQIAKRLNLRSRESLKPRIKSAKRGKDHGVGAPDRSWKWIRNQLLRPGHFQVMHHCVALIESFERWQGQKEDPLKDLLDATSYALRPMILDRQPSYVSKINLQF